MIRRTTKSSRQTPEIPPILRAANCRLPATFRLSLDDRTDGENVNFVDQWEDHLARIHCLESERTLVMGQYESRPFGEAESVLEQETKSATNRVVYIEDLLDADDVRPQIELEQASVNLRFFEWADRLEDECIRDYEHAVENLKQAAPNLREACVCGCYAFKPDLASLQTKETIEAEMQLIMSRFLVLVGACKKAGIHLTSIRFSVYWILDDKDLNSVDFEHLGKEVFGSETTITTVDHVEWKFLAQDTNVMLCFHFLNDQDYLDFPPGRSTWTKTWAHDLAH